MTVQTVYFLEIESVTVNGNMGRLSMGTVYSLETNLTTQIDEAKRMITTTVGLLSLQLVACKSNGDVGGVGSLSHGEPHERTVIIDYAMHPQVTIG